MASRRYNFNNVVNNSNEMYRKYIYETRGLSRGLVHFRTQTFSYPSQEELATLTTTRYTWKVGDRFSKIAFDYYGDVELWWVIAMFNRSPTEAFVKKGDIIYIPQPVERVMSMFRPKQEY